MRWFKKESEVFKYLEWREQNPTGFVLNINTLNPVATSMTNIIHDAGYCASLDKPPEINRNRPITPEHPKLCSTDVQDLIAEMDSKSLPYKFCGICMKKILIKR